MNRHIYTLLLPMVASALSICGCHKQEMHSEDYGLGISSKYEDSSESETQITDIQLFIYSSIDGGLVEDFSWNNARKLADTLFLIKPGDYTLIAASNLVQPFEVAETDKADNIKFCISDIPETQAYFGSANVTIKDAAAITVSEILFRRMLPELEIEFNGFPQGLTVSTISVNGAEFILPADKDNADRYGVPSQSSKEMDIKNITLSSDRQTSGIIRLMPTSQGHSTSLFRMKLTHADGRTTDCEVEAPRMDVAGRYKMILNYSEMKSTITLSPFEINDWAQGWSCSGSVSDPDQI